MIKQEGLYQNKVTVSLASIVNCKMAYWTQAYLKVLKNSLLTHSHLIIAPSPFTGIIDPDIPCIIPNHRWPIKLDFEYNGQFKKMQRVRCCLLMDSSKIIDWGLYEITTKWNITDSKKLLLALNGNLASFNVVLLILSTFITPISAYLNDLPTLQSVVSPESTLCYKSRETTVSNCLLFPRACMSTWRLRQKFNSSWVHLH